MDKLQLFYKPTCPFCHKVLTFLEAHQRELPLRDIDHDPAARDELLKTGGKTQVPCLFIDGQPLYESDDIIAWLRAHPVSAAA